MHHCLAPLLRAYYEWLSCVVHTICMFSYIPCTHACVCVRVGVFASSPAQSEQARDSSIAHSVCHYKAINSIQRNKLSSKNKTQSSATKFPSWNTTTNRYSRRLPLPFRCDDSLPKKNKLCACLRGVRVRAVCLLVCVLLENPAPIPNTRTCRWCVQSQCLFLCGSHVDYAVSPLPAVPAVLPLGCCSLSSVGVCVCALSAESQNDIRQTVPPPASPHCGRQLLCNATAPTTTATTTTLSTL